MEPATKRPAWSVGTLLCTVENCGKLRCNGTLTEHKHTAHFKGLFRSVRAPNPRRPSTVEAALALQKLALYVVALEVAVGANLAPLLPRGPVTSLKAFILGSEQPVRLLVL